MRSSGTLLSVEVSLGYDVSRHEIESALLDASSLTGLESPFVQIRELGDFSVHYQVSGLLTEVNRLIDKRRELRGRTMDVLHAAGIEIVSPTFMNTRAFDKKDQFIPEVEEVTESTNDTASTDALVFDKAEEAESVSRLKERLVETQERIRLCQGLVSGDDNPSVVDAATQELETLEQKSQRLSALIDKREAKISKD